MLEFIFGLFVGSWLLGSKKTKEKQEISPEAASLIMILIGVPILFLALYILFNLPDLLGATSSLSTIEVEGSKNSRFSQAIRNINALWPHLFFGFIAILSFMLYFKKYE